jgi:hypothetical protein
MALNGLLPRSLPLLAATALAVAMPAAADWLVMHDGTKVETKGAWEVRGATVVFHTPDGTLASVRSKDADLDASREATARAAAPVESAEPTGPAEAKSADKKPTLTITDADVGHVDAATVAAGSAAQAASKQGTPEPAAGAKPQRLQITEWHQDLDASQGGVVLVGDVRNISREVVGEIKVTAKVYDEKGTLLATAEALLGTNVLPPDQHTPLRASFPGVYNFSKSSFDIEGLALRSYAGAAETPKNP